MVTQWLASGALELPLPGAAPPHAWLRLAELTETDVVAGRLAEAHADAVAILAELDGRNRSRISCGVCGRPSPPTRCVARGEGDAVTLDGTKAWCSGAGLCSHALVTARLASGDRALFAVDLHHPAVTPLPSAWRNPGMARIRHALSAIHRRAGGSGRTTRRVPDPARFLARRHRRQRVLAWRRAVGGESAL